MVSAENINVSFKNYLIFLNLITQHCHKLENFHVYAENFKLKLVKAVAISLNSKEVLKANTEHFEEFISLIKVFQLSAEHCVEIIHLLVDNLS